jgi:hypothetical protein
MVGAALTRLFAGWCHTNQQSLPRPGGSRWRKSRVAAGRWRLGSAAAPGGPRRGAAGGTGGAHGCGEAVGLSAVCWPVWHCPHSLLVSVAPPRISPLLRIGWGRDSPVRALNSGMAVAVGRQHHHQHQHQQQRHQQQRSSQTAGCGSGSQFAARRLNATRSAVVCRHRNRG